MTHQFKVNSNVHEGCLIYLQSYIMYSNSAHTFNACPSICVDSQLIWQLRIIKQSGVL